MDGNPKQQVAEKLRNSNSVLITVSNNPSVDQLAAGIGLSLMLTKLGKHTTAVFSGNIPNAIQFLNPEKTFDSTVDGLRDFIISLDKEKADKLRYKVEDDVVKIFITPYKAKITEDDLVFSQGDFNVDLVVALGVHKRGELDEAITSHGRILHDASIITINSGSNQPSDLGTVDWTEENASCLSEMLVSISEALEGGILDSQMSTAFLTGIVAATERFKNNNTTPKVMTMAAQLMAAGANQQLIATNLQKTGENSNNKPEEEKKGQGYADEDQTLSVDRSKKKKGKKGKKVSDDTVLDDIETAVHAKHLKLDETGRTKRVDSEDPAIKKLEDELSHDDSSSLIDLEDKFKTESSKDFLVPDPNPAPPLPEPPKIEQRPESQKTESMIQPIHQPKAEGISNVKAVGAPIADQKPALGGTFNATASQAHDEREEARSKAINHEILNHGPDREDVFDGPRTTKDNLPDSASLMHDLELARKEVEEAMNESQFTPAGHPIQALNAVPMDLDQQGASEDIQLGHQEDPAMGFPQPTQPMQPQQQMPQQPMAPMPQQMPMQDPNMGFPQPQQQMPQQPMQPQPMPQPQQQVAMNPLFGNYNPSAAPEANGNMQNNIPPQMGPNPAAPPSSPPPMPPVQPPPMPPFN